MNRFGFESNCGREGRTTSRKTYNEYSNCKASRIAFLTEQLKLKPLRAQVIDAIPDLIQPARPN